MNFHCFTGPKFDFQGGWFTTAKILRKLWSYILIEENFIVFLYVSNTEYTLHFPFLIFSIVLVAGLLLSLCIVIAQNLLWVRGCWSLLCTHNWGRFCGAFVPVRHRNATRETAVMQITLCLCMTCDTRYFLLLPWVTKHRSAPMLKKLANLIHCRLIQFELILEQEWNVNSFAFKTRDYIAFPKHFLVIPKCPLLPSCCTCSY